MSRTSSKLLLAATLFALSTAASATALIGATKVRITSALPDYLQVGDLIATRRNDRYRRCANEYGRHASGTDL